MKSFIFLESKKKFNTNRQLKKSLKVFIGAAIVGCLMIGALVVWGGIAAFRTISTFATTPIIQEKILNFETEIQNMPVLNDVGCWATVQDFMNAEVWFQKPIVENFNNIKSACLNK